MADYIREWEIEPTTDTSYYGIYYPEDGYLSVNYATPGEAVEFLSTLQGTDNPMVEGAYVVRVQIERVDI